MADKTAKDILADETAKDIPTKTAKEILTEADAAKIAGWFHLDTLELVVLMGDGDVKTALSSLFEQMRIDKYKDSFSIPTFWDILGHSETEGNDQTYIAKDRGNLVVEASGYVIRCHKAVEKATTGSPSPVGKWIRTVAAIMLHAAYNFGFWDDNVESAMASMLTFCKVTLDGKEYLKLFDMFSK